MHKLGLYIAMSYRILLTLWIKLSFHRIFLPYPKKPETNPKQNKTRNSYLFTSLETWKKNVILLNFWVVIFWPCQVSSGLLWIVSMAARRNGQLASEPNCTPLLENKQFWRQYPQDLCSYLETVFGYKRLHYTLTFLIGMFSPKLLGVWGNMILKI